MPASRPRPPRSARRPSSANAFSTTPDSRPAAGCRARAATIPSRPSQHRPAAAPCRSAGRASNVPGFRNAPSLRYVALTPAFFFDDESTPTGGFDRDGRADSLAAQAERPFLAAHEMANASLEDVIVKLARAPYVDDFRALFGPDALATPNVAFDRMLFALQQYEREDTEEFAPFTSRYDAFLAGRAQLSAHELRGLALFNDPARGNCAGCHPSGRRPGAEPPLFTDFTYDNLGVPRNADIPANADPAYFDIGLCGPARTDIVADRPDLCGAFKVPTLRNVALTAPYFHNGRFATLREALQFYVLRDTNPEQLYPLDAGGQALKFDDLPDAYKANVNTTEVPYDRRSGDVPALSDGDIEDVIAFLNTLTDGYQP
jgi:cytochrome c peroxidase